MNRIPGLRQHEALILQTFQRLNPDFADSYEYNVSVGPGIDPGAGHLATVRSGSIRNSQRKVDAIATKGDAVTLIEVKERAQLAAIGQLLGYQHHYGEDHPGAAPPALLLLTARPANGIQDVAAKNNITVTIVPVDFSALTGPV